MYANRTCVGASVSGAGVVATTMALWNVGPTWQVRLATKRRIEPTPDYATFKRDPIVAAAYDVELRRGLATMTVEDGDAAGRLSRLCEAAGGLPLVKRRPLSKRWSAQTRNLYTRSANDATTS